MDELTLGLSLVVPYVQVLRFCYYRDYCSKHHLAQVGLIDQRSEEGIF